MNRYLKGVVLSSAVLFLVCACLLETNLASAMLQRRSVSRTKRVEQLFNRNCARCHGGDGKGTTPLGQLYHAPDFTDNEWWNKNTRTTTPARLRLAIIKGKAGMPAFGKKLTRSEINLLVERVRSFRKLERKS